MARIYSRGGDRGETALRGGPRVPKDDPRIAALGELDELNAQLGLARSAAEPELGALLASVQRDLLALGSCLASAGEGERRPASDPKVDWGPSRLERLEREIDTRDAQLPALRRFVLPGGSPAGAALHLARTVCRRAERAVVTVVSEGELDPCLLAYLNRLSDLLFVLARAANAAAGVADVEW
jgi:cob(I)alamin adenosyltransferase